MRHARNATRITIDVAEHGDLVPLTICDDGDGGSASRPTSGYGLIGMTERTSFLGGTLRAGPGPEGGWMVEAALPRGDARAGWSRAAKVVVGK